MKKLTAAILALALTLSLGVPSVFAADALGATFVPSVDPGKTEQITTVETGIAGMTLSIGADTWTLGDTTVTSDSGVTYSGYIVGAGNPKVASGTGTFYVFAFDDTVGTGTLEVMCRQGGGKQFFILDNGTAMNGYDGTMIDATANVSYTIVVQGGHTYTVYTQGSKLRLYGCTFKNVDPAKEFAAEISGFSFDKIKGANADKDHVDEDLVLVDSYESQFGSCDVSWTSSDSTVIATNGTVNCQKTETKVVLTGHFQVQENREFKADVAFEVTVAADPDDNSAVAVAAQALTLGDTSAVKRNLELPTSGKRGTSVTWSTSDAAVVGADGKVYPAADEDRSAVLTATITRGSASTTKDFAVTVAGMVPVTVDAWSYKDANGGVRYTPVDGGTLNSVNVTCNNPNPGDSDVIVVAVYGADGQEKSSKSVSMKETFANIPAGKSVAVPVGLPMNSGDTFQVTAMNAATSEQYTKPFQNDDTLAEGAAIYVVGDSTASVYGDERYPRKGWAQLFGGYFNGVEVVDLALSGRASQSFKKEANYTTLKDSLKKGDYLIVQFGHNDNKAESFTDPAGDRFTDGAYKESMLEYVELAWEKGAHPIIATSISRRKTSDASLEPYVNAAKELAAELNVPCIDLYAKTNGWINEVGVEAAKDMFNYVKKDDPRFMSYANFSMSEFYGKDSTDDTHINIYGADLISQWAADAMKEMGLPVVAKMSDHRAVYPLPSYANGTVPPAAAANRPADLDSTKWWYAAAVECLDKGILNGTDKGFDAGAEITTATVYQTLYNIEKADVKAEGEWYAPAMTWAAEQKLYSGNVASFQDGVINRENTVKIMDAYCAMKGVSAKLFQGNESGDMMLDKNLTRAEWAQVLVNFEAAT